MNINNLELFKEIDLIQDCIKRISKNSFLVKGWGLTILAGVFAIANDKILSNVWLLIFTVIIPFLCFWMLDTFFLRTEKKYRLLYSWGLENRKKGNIDLQYDLNPNRFSEQAGCWIKTMFSYTMILFYMIPIAVICLACIFGINSFHAR